MPLWKDLSSTPVSSSGFERDGSESGTMTTIPEFFVHFNVFKYMRYPLFAFVAIVLHTGLIHAQERIFILAQDSGRIAALLYGEGERAVVLVHGGRFRKESWEDQAKILSSQGFRVLSIDLRGFGESTGPGQHDPYTAPMHLDVLAAVRHLRSSGSKSVSIVGASMGGWAAADASILSEPGEIDRIIILAASINSSPEKLKGRTMYAIAQGDTTANGVPRLVRIREQYERTPQPKELLILEGSAHAQYVFRTNEGDRLMSEIVRFLLAP